MKRNLVLNHPDAETIALITTQQHLKSYEQGQDAMDEIIRFENISK